MFVLMENAKGMAMTDLRKEGYRKMNQRKGGLGKRVWGEGGGQRQQASACLVGWQHE